jgi:hypothetical protein
MTTTLELHVRKIQWFCQQGEGFCMHVFSSLIVITALVLEPTYSGPLSTRRKALNCPVELYLNKLGLLH